MLACIQAEEGHIKQSSVVPSNSGVILAGCVLGLRHECINYVCSVLQDQPDSGLTTWAVAVVVFLDVTLQSLLEAGTALLLLIRLSLNLNLE